MEKKEMSKEDQKILYDWTYRRLREFYKGSDEVVKRDADKYFNNMFEYGEAKEFLEMAKKDEPFNATLFKYIEE